MEDAGEHGAVEAAGVGVAERGVVAAEEGDAVGESVFGAMGEGVGGAAFDDAFVEEMGEVAVPGDFAEADDDADLAQGGDFGGEVDAAVADFLGRGLVAGRGAADDGADPELAELEAVVAGDGFGFGGEAELVEDGVHEVAGAIAGKWPTRPVGAVSAGGEAEDEDAGVVVSEAGNGFCPVFLIAKGGAAGLAEGVAVVAESGAAGTIDDALLELADYF